MSAPEQIDDGGPAFPGPSDYTQNGSPVWGDVTGMSLRDWFAGMALQGYNANRTQCANMTHEQAASNAYRDADAMLAARERGGK